jgi:hypothetical protein
MWLRSFCGLSTVLMSLLLLLLLLLISCNFSYKILHTG